MQEKSTRRSNRERTEKTRAALITAARKLFIEKGYADTGTPDIVESAQVTRGALYHHFTDKLDLFRAVVLAEASTVADQIMVETDGSSNGIEALMIGADAYFRAMAKPGRAHILLIDGPAVLGSVEMAEIDRANGGNTLQQGLEQVMTSGDLNANSRDALAEILSAGFDKAALAIAEGKPAEDYKHAIQLVLKGLV